MHFDQNNLINILLKICYLFFLPCKWIVNQIVNIFINAIKGVKSTLTIIVYCILMLAIIGFVFYIFII